MSINEKIKNLKDNIKLVDAELSKNQILGEVFSGIDRSVLPSLNASRDDLNRVAVDLYQQLGDAEREELDREAEYLVDAAIKETEIKDKLSLDELMGLVESGEVTLEFKKKPKVVIEEGVMTAEEKLLRVIFGELGDDLSSSTD